MQKEKWKKLKEEKGYLISSWGRIFSLKTKRFIRYYIHNSRANKYLRVCLAEKKYMLHVLVANNFKHKQYKEIREKFPDAIIQANHDDRNTLNCNANNISFMTNIDNKKHLWETQNVTFGGKTYKGRIEQ